MTGMYSSQIFTIIMIFVIIAVIFVLLLAEKTLAVRKNRICGLIIPVGAVIIALVCGLCLNWQYAGCRIQTITQTTADGYEMSMQVRIDRNGEVIDYNGIDVRSSEGVLLDRLDFEPEPDSAWDEDCVISAVPDRYYYNEYAEKMIEGMDFGKSAYRIPLDENVNRIYFTRHIFTEKNPILALVQLALIYVTIPTLIIYAAARTAGSGKRRRDNLNSMKLADL